MFRFLNDMFTYEQRKVARYEGKNFVIDTCAMSDSTKPYETAISHLDYNDGAWIIVEEYDNKDDALVGHEKWLSIMSSDILPEELISVSTCEISILGQLYGTAYKRHQNIQESVEVLPGLEGLEIN